MAGVHRFKIKESMGAIVKFQSTSKELNIEVEAFIWHSFTPTFSFLDVLYFVFIIDAFFFLLAIHNTLEYIMFRHVIYLY